ncbi:hypothetical protein B0H14DRAFT_3465070 [Mycena olivaceomarginata]|nr:hypothetical protein B0H14DRAFT_3465070 [Mycena olivaceomarginata]
MPCYRRTRERCRSDAPWSLRVDSIRSHPAPAHTRSRTSTRTRSTLSSVLLPVSSPPRIGMRYGALPVRSHLHRPRSRFCLCLRVHAPCRVHASTHTFPSSADYARPPSRLAWPSFRIEHIHRTGTPPPRPQASAWHIQLLPRAVPRVAASHTTEAIRFDPSCARARASAHTHTRARICALNAPLHMRMLPCILRALSFGPWHTSPSETSIPHTAGAPPDSRRRRRVHVGKEKRHKE